VAAGVVRSWELAGNEGTAELMNAASLVKLVLGHLALALVPDLDEPISGGITSRHVLSHTTGLPNWRPEGQPLAPLRPPGTGWGYSGEGFVLLQSHLEHTTGRTIDELAGELVFEPLGMTFSRFDEPEPGFHGYRPLLTTGAEFGTFLAHVLSIDDERWQPQWQIDDELAWGAGWGLEVGPPICGWQWGSNPAASNFVIGCPSTGDGVVVFTDAEDGRAIYRKVVQDTLPGDHPSLRLERNSAWRALFI
jgi:CubicO group peptidase (beta-lactamase class C family)